MAVLRHRLRAKLLSTTLLAAVSITSGFLFTEIASSQTIGIASVNGTILDTDGTRILYRPSSQKGQLDLLDILSNTTTVISFGSSYVARTGFLTPLGAAFVADNGSILDAVVFNYNGSLTNIAFPNGESSLKVAGRYAEFSGTTDRTCCSSNLYFLDTTTGSLVQIPGSYSNGYNDVASTGVVAAWTQGSQIVSFSGGNLTEITVDPSLNNYFPVTDGTLYVFRRSSPCCVP